MANLYGFVERSNTYLHFPWEKCENLKNRILLQTRRVSVKRGVGVGVGVTFIFVLMFFFPSFNPNSDFSQFASAMYRYNIFRYNNKKMCWS